MLGVISLLSMHKCRRLSSQSTWIPKLSIMYHEIRSHNDAAYNVGNRCISTKQVYRKDHIVRRLIFQTGRSGGLSSSIALKLH